MVKPLISIIIPVYNVERYLERCFNTIINQTISKKEIIFVNDGSTDSSPAILENFKKQYPEIVIINKKNGGLSSARNTGINIARGEFIGFVDSDDYIDESMFEKMVNHAKRNQADVVICKYKSVFENGVIEDSKGFSEERVMNGFEGFKEYLNKKDFANHAVDKIYRKELFIENNIRYPEGKYYEDAFTTYKLIYKSKKIAYLNQYLYYYFQRPGSITNSIFSDKELDYIEALKEIKNYISENNIVGIKEEYEKMCIKVTLAILSKLNNNMYKNKISRIEFSRYKEFLLNYLNENFNGKNYSKNNFIKQKIALLLISVNYSLFYFMDNMIKELKSKEIFKA